jgi:enoyl-CoA hydratase/carnithine racemase
VSSISLEREPGLVTVLMESAILARRVLADLSDALEGLVGEADAPPLVLASAHPTIFLAGADLVEIAELDPTSCISYADFGRSLAARIASFPAPVVAAVHGSCSGGGLDLVAACDLIVASPNATFAHPGIHRGLVTGWGGTASVSELMGGGTARRLFLEGLGIDGAEFDGLGPILTIADNPLDNARSAARRLGLVDPSRLAAWRRLRGPSFVDRFRAFMVEKS